MKQVQRWEASDGKTFSSAHDCMLHEQQELLEKRLASRLTHSGSFDKWSAEQLAEKLVRYPANLKAVLDASLLQELYTQSMPDDNEVVFVVAFKFPHHDRSNAENRAMLDERLVAVADGDEVLTDCAVLDIVAGGPAEDE